jgi:hypothetical protein
MSRQSRRQARSASDKSRSVVGSGKRKGSCTSSATWPPVGSRQPPILGPCSARSNTGLKPPSIPRGAVRVKTDAEMLEWLTLWRADGSGDRSGSSLLIRIDICRVANGADRSRRALRACQRLTTNPETPASILVLGEDFGRLGRRPPLDLGPPGPHRQSQAVAAQSELVLLQATFACPCRDGCLRLDSQLRRGEQRQWTSLTE